MNKEEELVPFTDEQELNYAFNGCVCYINNGYLSFCSIEEFRNRKEADFEDISFEYYVENKQITHSFYASLVKNKREIKKKNFQDDLARRYGRSELKFHDNVAKQRILDFIGKGKCNISAQSPYLRDKQKELENIYSYLTNEQKLTILNSGLDNLQINTTEKKKELLDIRTALKQEERNFNLSISEKEDILRLITSKISSEQLKSYEAYGVPIYNAA
ncbi:9171_t:CDS:2, partial [Ambispora gerdemannii]